MSPEQFLAVANFFSESALLLNTQGEVLAANRESANLGLASDRTVGRSLFEFTATPPEDVRNYLKACARTNHSVVGSLSLQANDQQIDCRCDGAVVFRDPQNPAQTRLLIKLVPKSSPQNRFALLSLKVDELTHEIGRRRKAEKLAQDQSESLRVTLESIGDGVIVTDARGHVTFLNSVAQMLTGWNLHQASGVPLTTVFNIVNEYTGLEVENPVHKVLREGRIVGLANHTILIARDGSRRCIDDSAAPIRQDDGTIIGVVLVFRDVTERRRSDLAQSRLAALVESSDDAIIGYSFECVVTNWNTGAERLFGFTALEAIGRPVDQLIVPPERVEELLYLLHQLRNGVTIGHFESVRMHRDGRRIPVSIRLSPIRDTHGQMVGISAIDRDISEQRAAQRRRSVRLAVSQALTREDTIDGAVQTVLQTVCGVFEWQIGCFWQCDPQSNSLRLSQFWTKEPARFQQFEEESRTKEFAKGEGIPGGVWADLQPVWVEELSTKRNLKRLASLRASGLHSALACPVRAGEQFRGVIEIFCREHCTPDEDLQELLCSIGDQIGQFIEKISREQRLQFQAHLLDSVGQAAIASDPQGHVLYWNKYAQTLFGYSTTEAMELHVLQLVTEQDQDRISVIFERLRQGESWSGELRLQRQDRSTFPAWTTLVPVFDSNGRLQAIVAASSDVSEQKRTESTLRFLADASDSLATLVDYKSTLQRVVHLAVPNFADWSAIDIVQPDGQLQRLAVSHVQPDLAEQAMRLYRKFPLDPQTPHGVHEVARTGQCELVTEVPASALEAFCRDPEHFSVLRELGLNSYICVPLVAQGKVVGVLSFVLSRPGAHYRPEDKAIAEDLANRATIAIENASLYQQLKEADRRKDDFLAMLGHELRNPLAPIRTGLEILSMQEAQHARVVQLMKQQVQHLVRLVDDLLDVSRIMRGKVELRKELVELSKIIRQSVDAVKPGIDEKNQHLHVSVERDIYLDADPVRLVQILQNLLHNASKYTDPGGRIELTAASHATEAIISVRDNGVGIEPEFLSKVFELFTQSSRSLDRSQGGLGIGLTLAQTLVEMHGGTIAAESDGHGKGSMFTVRLPLCKPTRPQEVESPEDTASAARRVLVVDDNLDAAQMLSMLIRQMGPHIVEVARNGYETLEVVSRFDPDLVLLDIGLPGMDGYEVARRLRRSSGLDQLVLVALTGYGQEEDRRRSRNAGFDEHLVKPVAIETLKSVLQMHRR